MKGKTSWVVLTTVLAWMTSANTVFSQTPKPMLDNVYALTEAAAVLNVCFESHAYKSLPNEKALQIHDLSMRLEDLVQRIANRYNHETLLLVFGMSKVKISSDKEMIESVRKEYGYCNEKLFKNMETYVSENETIVDDFLSKRTQKKGTTPWLKPAKAAYVNRCASSMMSQGLPKQYAQPYCICIADGMEDEFGMEEYDHMMTAQPNASGSSYDRRLYEVFTACSHVLPK